MQSEWKQAISKYLLAWSAAANLQRVIIIYLTHTSKQGQYYVILRTAKNAYIYYKIVCLYMQIASNVNNETVQPLVTHLANHSRGTWYCNEYFE